MNLKIEPDVEAELVARALADGQSLEDFIRSFLEREAASSALNRASQISPSDRARAFRAWAESFPPDLPVLNLEDISRENIYGRD
jgi:hypothetical protein